MDSRNITRSWNLPGGLCMGRKTGIHDTSQKTTHPARGSSLPKSGGGGRGWCSRTATLVPGVPVPRPHAMVHRIRLRATPKIPRGQLQGFRTRTWGCGPKPLHTASGAALPRMTRLQILISSSSFRSKWIWSPRHRVSCFTGILPKNYHKTKQDLVNIPITTSSLLLRAMIAYQYASNSTTYKEIISMPLTAGCGRRRESSQTTIKPKVTRFYSHWIQSHSITCLLLFSSYLLLT